MPQVKHNRLTLNCYCIACNEKKLRRQNRKMIASGFPAEQKPGQTTPQTTVKEEKEVTVKKEPSSDSKQQSYCLGSSTRW